MTKRIFISYSHDSESHQANVLNLADKLNKNGLDCNIDLYFPNPFEGWPRWIGRMINESDYVIIVFSKGYYEKLDENLHESNLGKGVVFEMTQILQELYNNKAFNNKFIPIVFDSKHEQYITRAFNAYTYYNLNSNDGYIMLYRHITSQRLYIKPIKGKIQTFDSLNSSGDEIFSYGNSENDIVVAVETAKIELTIDGNFEKFSFECKQKLLKSISVLLEMDEADIYIKRIKTGSIKVLIELPSHKAIELEQKISLGLLKNYKISNVEILVEDDFGNRQILDKSYFRIAEQFDIRVSLSFEKYLNEIEKVDFIPAEEEVKLIKQIKKGDKVALERMIKANLKIVVSIAVQYQNHGLSLHELVNEGNLGLIKAVQRYDETHGFKFISYIVWWIRQSILLALEEQARTIKSTLKRIESITNINEFFRHPDEEYLREPNTDEISLLETSGDFFDAALKISYNYVSQNKLSLEDKAVILFDSILEDSPNTDLGLMKKYLITDVETSLHQLCKQDTDLVCYYLGISDYRQYSFEEIYDRFKLSKDLIRKIKVNTIRRMTNYYLQRLPNGHL